MNNPLLLALFAAGFVVGFMAGMTTSRPVQVGALQPVNRRLVEMVKAQVG